MGFGRTMSYYQPARCRSSLRWLRTLRPHIFAEIHHLIPNSNQPLLTDLEVSVERIELGVRALIFRSGRRTRRLRPCLLHRRSMLFEWSYSLVLLPLVLFRISLHTRLSLRGV